MRDSYGWRRWEFGPTRPRRHPGDDPLVPGIWLHATWGTARAGWGTYQDRFADVFWFLWDDESSERVLHAATELADHLADALGEPTETTEPTPLSGGTWWWQLEGHSIEMYAYTDARTPDGHPTGPPCVQLSVDLREVSDPREAEARRLQGAPGFG